MQPENQPPQAAPNPIDQLELPRVEPVVVSDTRSPHRTLYTALAVLILLAGAGAAYYILKKSS